MTVSKTRSQEFAIPSFLDLPEGELQRLSQEAVLLDLKRKLNKDLPIVVWNDGRPYNKYADGRIEYIAL
ncbi:MAG: hypothetical protein HC805_03670 [Alkalinema sp. RL_2_19]|nr:hypothetical protein [Alkalinema sp. RL_2_19]